jgi:O-antigen ligase
MSGLMGAIFLMRFSALWLVLFTLGIHFDDLFVPLGFAKVGYGDFALLLMLGYWVLWRLHSKSPMRLPDGWPLVIIYAIGVGISWLLGPSPQAMTGLFIRNCLYVIGYFALVDLLTKERQILIFLLTTLGAVLAHSVIALALDNPNARVDGLVGQPNIFGGLIGPGAIIAFSLASSQQTRRWMKVLLVVVGTLISLVLILTVSRGAQVAFACATLWIYRRKWRSVVAVLVVAVIVFQLILIIDPDRFGYFLERWELEDGSVSTRQGLIVNALRVINEYPFFGVGFAQFTLIEDVMQIDAGHGRASHNHYLGEFATIGIPSALALFAFIMLQGRLLWRTNLRIGSERILASTDSRSPHSSKYHLRLDNKRMREQNDDAQHQERSRQRQRSRERALSQMYLIVLQGLMVFQSITLIFRGGRRMIEWSFLAIYTAAVLIYQNSSSSDEQ